MSCNLLRTFAWSPIYVELLLLEPSKNSSQCQHIEYATLPAYAGFGERAVHVNMLQQSRVNLYAQATQQNDSKLFQEAQDIGQQIGDAVKDAVDSSNGYSIQPFWGLHQVLIPLAPQDAQTRALPLMTPVHQDSLTYDTMILERGDDVLLCSSCHGVHCLCQLKFKTTDKLLGTRQHDLLQSSLYHMDEVIKQGNCSRLRFVYASLRIDHAQKDNPAGQWRDQQSSGFQPSDAIVQTLHAMFKKAYSEELEEKRQALQPKPKQQAGKKSRTSKRPQQTSEASLHQATASRSESPLDLPSSCSVASEPKPDTERSSELKRKLDELKQKHQQRMDFLDDELLFCEYLQNTQLMQLSSWEELREAAVTALVLFICSACQADVAGLTELQIKEVARAVLADLYFGRVDASLQTGAAYHAHQEAAQTRLRQQSETVIATATKAAPQAPTTAAIAVPVPASATAPATAPATAHITAPATASATALDTTPASAPATDPTTTLTTASATAPITAPTTTYTNAPTTSASMMPIKAPPTAATPAAARKAADKQAAKAAKETAKKDKAAKAAIEKVAKEAAKKDKAAKAATEKAAKEAKAVAEKRAKAAAKEEKAAAKAGAPAHDQEKRTLRLTEVRSHVTQLVKQFVQGFQGDTEMMRRFKKYQQVTASWTKLTTEIDELGAELYLQVTDPLVEEMQQQPHTEGSERVAKAKMRAHYISEAHRRAVIMPNPDRDVGT